jgi:hypothetical protein
MDGLSIPEVKDCVKSASLGLQYNAPHATTTTTLKEQLEQDVKRMVGAADRDVVHFRLLTACRFCAACAYASESGW